MASGTGKAGPGGAAYTMYLDQSAHLDWDWIQTFEENFQHYPAQGNTPRGGVKQILDIALAKLAADPSYYYTICEMGFLRRYIEEYPPGPGTPGAAATIRSFGDRFQALGGGITSPDCQVCSGEGFIRNYLVGRSWLKRAIGLEAKPHCWLPDDFGQGPELPALLAALGFASMSFTRLPTTQPYWQGPQPLKDYLLANGLDFIWTASDGSSVYAHWLTGWYSIGNDLWQAVDGSPAPERLPAAINHFLADYQPTSGATPGDYSGARTPFMYVPIDDDFSLPIDGLAQDIADWNGNAPDVAPGGLAATGVEVVQGTFDQFMTGLIAANEANPTLVPFSYNGTTSYNGTPYWTGYYASRPELKILHYRCVRALTAAEIFGLLAGGSGALPATFWSDVEAAWDNFAPSTHHDYVCGTATDCVYQSEQLPLLSAATNSLGNPVGALALRSMALSALAASCAPGGGVVVASSLGFARGGLAETEAAPVGTASFVFGGFAFPVQASAEGGTLVFADPLPLGYGVGTWSSAAPSTNLPNLSATPNPDGSVTLANGVLAATIDRSGNLAALAQAPGGPSIVVPPGPGGDLGFYRDEGGLYRFGNEQPPKQMSRDPGVGVSSTSFVISESGPLRVRVTATIVAVVQGQSYTYVREYALVATEPFLRVTVAGRAPRGYSVMAMFTLAGGPVALDHGTPGHWTSVQPGTLPGGAPLWPGPVFRATHDFVLPRDSSGDYLGGVYHGGIPAWAIDGTSVIGCLLRNTPGEDGLGASGSDEDAHVQAYALRVPWGLPGPETGAPQREALSFSTPLEAAAVPGAQGGQASSGALLSLPAETPAIVTVAKPGTYDPSSLILRLRQPTNAPLNVALVVGGPQTAPNLLTAAEQPWNGEGSVSRGASGLITVEMAGALATVELPGFLAAGVGEAEPR
ncbi:MAG: hypothetical protein JOZ90_09465 [Alphaproteobacteria bacterium]|nr:hypothetical protein [Alphaproteobacteria bacterium]MBV9371866.1 hypothetical protein [Alphaproteobacteria bacterium]MBV9901313.1 hypothetical protein [Alphaproteobacteria bacterium]